MSNIFYLNRFLFRSSEVFNINLPLETKEQEQSKLVNSLNELFVFFCVHKLFIKEQRLVFRYFYL
jgi:hypothetical protein